MSAEPLATPVRPRGPFWPLVAKDVREHVHRRRLFTGSAICMLLFAVAAVIRVQDFRQAHQERSLFLARWAPAVQEQIEREENVQVENTRAVSPLTVLSIGLEPIVPFRFTSTKEGLRFGPSRASQNTVDALFGHLDLAFVISTLLSLLCLALTFDSICGEQAQGTLALLMSYPLSRGMLLRAKITSNAIVVALCFVPAYVFTATAVAASGVPLLDLRHWLAYGVAALLYLLVFVTIGVAISARGGTPSDAVLRCLLVWVVFVFLVPRGVGLTIGRMFPSSRAVELALAEDEALSRLKLDYSRKLRRAFEVYLASPSGPAREDEFRRSRAAASEEMRRERHLVLDRMWDDLVRREADRQRWVASLSVLSPTALFNTLAAELAWTGDRQRAHMIAEARVYDEKIGRPLAESRQSYFGRAPGGESRGVVTYDDIRPYLIPFHPTWAPSRTILAGAVVPIVVLLLFAVTISTLGARALARLDLRLR